MNIIKNRYLYFGISLVVIIPGILALIFWHLPLGIDFTGGSLLEVKFDTGTPLSGDAVSAIYADYSVPSAVISNPVVQPMGNDSLSIRSKVMDDATKSEIISQMESQSGSTITVLHFTQVSASVGEEVAARAAGAVALAAVAILLYITYAFRGVQHAFRYGTAAIIAMLHDVLVVVGVEAILGHYLGWEADSLFLTALLTVIGFSVHDSIVVFDRIRENSGHYKKLTYET